MSHNQKVLLFSLVMVGTVVALWGVKGITNLLPGPNAK